MFNILENKQFRLSNPIVESHFDTPCSQMIDNRSSKEIVAELVVVGRNKLKYSTHSLPCKIAIKPVTN